MSVADQLIVQAGTGLRMLTRDELQQVLEHIAHVGFDPKPDRRGITAAEVHFRKHVEQFREWPEGTTIEEYLDSARRIILDEESSILVSRYFAQWQIAIVRRPGELRGPRGTDWVVVEYRVGLGYWVTLFQPRDLEHDFLVRSGREGTLWLRKPI